MRIVPSWRVIILFLVPIPLMVASIFVSWLLWIAVAIDALLLLGIVIDIILLPATGNNFTIKLDLPGYMQVHRNSTITIHVTNNHFLPVRFNLLLDLDFSFERTYSQRILLATPYMNNSIPVKVFARRRGTFPVTRCFVKMYSFFGLVIHHQTLALSDVVKVVPSTSSLNETFSLLQANRKKYEGRQRNRILGQGMDFEMLREYYKGDDFNKIDWKATARRRKPITRIYRMENNFDVSIMLDCGRLMTAEIGGMSLLDYAINSTMVLAYSAIKGHDKVSFTAFGSDIKKHIPPTRNKKIVKNLNHVLTDLDYEFVESNLQYAFNFVRKTLPKRSLIVLFTDIIDDSNIKIYHRYLSILMKKHIVMLILLRDKSLFEIASSKPGPDLTSYTIAASSDLILRRYKTIHDLEKLGIIVLDLFPEQVTAGVINSYMKVKYKH
jgi:uncharacterized protein (DUF58 family)